MLTSARLFKALVYSTNHINVEKALLRKEILNLTVRLIIMNAYKQSDPELTDLIQRLYRSCPLLFESLMPRSEIEDLAAAAAAADVDEADEDEPSVELQADDSHLRPSAIGCLPARHVRQVLGFPLRSSQMIAAFKELLTRAYDVYYSSPAILHFGKVNLQWVKKISFTDKYVILP